MTIASDRPKTADSPRVAASVRGFAASLSWSMVATLALSTIAGAFFVLNAVHRWNAFETNAYDLAFFDQIIWNTAHGRWFDTSFVEYNFAGQHMEPILLLFVPAYWLGASPLALTIVQGVVTAAAAPVLYLAARRFGLGERLALAMTAAYLLNPYLHRAVDFDFHPEVMVALPVFASALAVAHGRMRLAAVLALSTMLFKEDAAFVALALAALIWVRGGRREALVTGAIAVAYAVVVVLVVMPILRDGAPSDIVERYGYLVGTSNQADFVPRLITRPWVIPQELLAPAQLWTAALLLVVTAPLAVLRPKLLVFVVPGLAVALLSSHASQRALELHYSAEIVPLLIVFGLAGAQTVRNRVSEPFVSGTVLATVLSGFLAMSPFSPFEYRPDSPSESHTAALAGALALVPADADVFVSAQSGLLPRLSQRSDAWEFPGGATSADWVVVDRYGHRSSQSIASGYDATLAEIRTTFELVYARDGVEVFRRPQ